MRCPQLHELPPPPPGKTGWPWTEASARPNDDLNGNPPKISVVTPSFNQVRYLEETIRSVLLQSYPSIELLVIDGGSTDGSIELIKRYEPWIAYWESEKDRGQSHALNKGFARATGAWVGWQNSDDIYHANCFAPLARAVLEHPEASVLYGQLLCIDEMSRVIRPNSASEFRLEDGIPWFALGNQSLFFRRDIFDSGMYLDESFHHCMDSEFWWRLIFAGRKFQYVPEMSGGFRIHGEAKTAKQQNVNLADALRVFEKIFAWPGLPPSTRAVALARLQSFACTAFDRGESRIFDESTALFRTNGAAHGVSLGFRFRCMARSFGGPGAWIAQLVGQPTRRLLTWRDRSGDRD